MLKKPCKLQATFQMPYTMSSVIGFTLFSEVLVKKITFE